MFDLFTICAEKNGFFSCYANIKNQSEAEQIRKAYIGPVRQINLFSDLYCIKERLILEAPNREILLKLIDILNHSVEW